MNYGLSNFPKDTYSPAISLSLLLEDFQPKLILSGRLCQHGTWAVKVCALPFSRRQRLLQSKYRCLYRWPRITTYNLFSSVTVDFSLMYPTQQKQVNLLTTINQGIQSLNNLKVIRILPFVLKLCE